MTHRLVGRGIRPAVKAGRKAGGWPKGNLFAKREKDSARCREAASLMITNPNRGRQRGSGDDAGHMQSVSSTGFRGNICGAPPQTALKNP